VNASFAALRSRLAMPMMAVAVVAALATTALLAAARLGPDAPGTLDFDAGELQRVLALGPWPAVPPPDPSNRVSGRPEAVAFGEVLFHSTQLSRVQGLRCASCHEPWRRFTDGRVTGLGAHPGKRNTPSVLNVSLQRWFGWDGANDNLWAQSIRPMLDADEMDADPGFVAGAVRGDDRLKAMYLRTFGHAPGDDDLQVLVDAAKALAAYQETLLSPRAPFDDFRDALLHGDRVAAAAYPLPAQRGLRLFVGRAQCVQCHSGPAFSDGRFHASLLPGRSPADGRAAALKRLVNSPFTLGGRFTDGGPRRPPEAAEDGAFRTPGLREVAATAPYLHDGSVAGLCDTLSPHAAPPPDVAAPALSLDERNDLVAFLLTLGSDTQAPLVDPASLRCR